MAIGIENQHGAERQRDRDDIANLPGGRPRRFGSYHDAIVAAAHFEMKQKIGSQIFVVHQSSCNLGTVRSKRNPVRSNCELNWTAGSQTGPKLNEFAQYLDRMFGRGTRKYIDARAANELRDAQVSGIVVD